MEQQQIRNFIENSVKHLNQMKGHGKMSSEKIEEYLNSLNNPITKYLASKIIDNTTYISIDDYMESLQMLAKRLPERFNLHFTPASYYHSDHWVIVLVWEIIKDSVVTIVTGLDKKIDNDLPIVFLDDIILSGVHNLGKIDDYTYDYKEKWSEVIKNKIVVAVSFYCDYGFSPQLERLLEINTNQRNYDIIFIEKIEPVRKQQWFKDFLSHQKWDLEKYEDFIIEHFKVGYMIDCLLYADHKIAGDCSTFTSIYKAVVPNPEKQHYFKPKIFSE